MRGLKKDDTVGFTGGAGCLLLSELDPAWGLFWLVAGMLLIAWTLMSICRGKKPL